MTGFLRTDQSMQGHKRDESGTENRPSRRDDHDNNQELQRA